MAVKKPGQVHILNGDCLAATFPEEIECEIIIWREALIDGPLTDKDFFENRQRFISEHYSSTKSYAHLVLAEYGKIDRISSEDTVFLWFEEDAFCQINLWCLLNVIQNKTKNIYRVLPDFSNGVCCGFSHATPGHLVELLKDAVKAQEIDLQIAVNVWNSLQKGDLHKLNFLSDYSSNFFPNLSKSVQSVIEIRNGEILQIAAYLYKNSESVSEAFQKFSQRFPQYGLGDLQFANILKKSKQ